jgi:hypothetical protein
MWQILIDRLISFEATTIAMETRTNDCWDLRRLSVFVSVRADRSSLYIDVLSWCSVNLTMQTNTRDPPPYVWRHLSIHLWIHLSVYCTS